MKAYTALPAGRVECPKCNGTGRQAATDDQKKYAGVMAGYDFADNTIECRNCGGGGQFSRAQGHVAAKADGTGCTHTYTAQTIVNCLTKYTCSQCGDNYTIDSGD